MYTSQRQAAKIRLSFLRAVLRQEVGAFDTDLTNGKITSGISNHMSVIQDAIGEKVHPIISTNSSLLISVRRMLLEYVSTV